MRIPTKPALIHHKAFEKAVRRSQGRVAILVHPFFDPELAKQNEPYTKSLDGLLAAKRHLPLVVFEEHDRVSETFSRMRKAGAENLFFVPTEERDPEPLDGPSVFSRLKKAGVRLALVGGMYASNPFFFDRRISQPLLDKAELWVPQGKIPDRHPELGCVGDLHQRLVQAGFRAYLMPNLVLPDRPTFKREQKK